jgi:uncharacterized protein (DUF1330 family)
MTTQTARGYAIGMLEGVELGPEILHYIESIESTFSPFGGEWVIHGADPTVLEGEFTADIVVIGFPSVEDARDWYESPAYQELSDLRSAHSRSTILLVGGVADGYRAAETAAKLRAVLEQGT